MKMQDLKMQDLKMQDLKMQDLKMHDMKLQDLNMQQMKCTHTFCVAKMQDVKLLEFFRAVAQGPGSLHNTAHRFNSRGTSSNFG